MPATRLTTCSVITLVTTLLVGWRDDDSATPTSPSRQGASVAHAPGQGFAYFGDLGPSFWGGLDPSWGACAKGRVQSPVDLSGNLVRSRSHDNKLSFDYGSTTGEIFNNGHTTEIETEGHDVLTIDGVAYSLAQFHFHVPSEHTIEGHGYDMELHLVHTSAAGDNVVVAVFLDRGATSGALSPIFDQLPDDFNVHHELHAAFDPRAFLPDVGPNARYVGSLTTPPCTEGVRWVVLLNPGTVSSEDLAQFHERVHSNARPVQRSLH
jgi:carbonic anhydrase